MIARQGITTEPLLANVFLARRMNLILGGPFFNPWDIPNLSEDVIETILSIEDINEIESGLNRVESIFQEWRSKYNARIKH